MSGAGTRTVALASEVIPVLVPGAWVSDELVTEDSTEVESAGRGGALVIDTRSRRKMNEKN